MEIMKTNFCGVLKTFIRVDSNLMLLKLLGKEEYLNQNTFKNNSRKHKKTLKCCEPY